MKRPKLNKAKKAKAPRKRSSGGRGKAKGSAFERDVCKALSLWMTGGKKDDLFWRSAMSGGRATVGLRSGKDVQQAGDICSVSPEGHTLTDHFYVECKFYKDLRFDRFFLQRSAPLWGFWEETCKQARIYGRTPMLIAKQNGYPTVVITKPLKLRGLTREDLYSIYAPCMIDRYSCNVTLFETMLAAPFFFSRVGLASNDVREIEK